MFRDIFDKNLYLRSLRLTAYVDKARPVEPSKSLLYDIVKKHSQVIAYHNLGVYKATSMIDLSIESLQDRLLVKMLGGMCYETSELLWHALTSFGFKAHRIQTVVLNNKPFNKDTPSTHNILIVFFEDNRFLIDVGFGYNSIREPLPFSFTKTEAAVTLLGEKYVLSCELDYYVLSMEIQNEQLTFYRFNKIQNCSPEIIDAEQTVKNYSAFINYSGFSRIRDGCIKCGKTTELGRVGFEYDNQDKLFTKITFDRDFNIRKFFVTKDEFEQCIYKELNISLDLNKLL